MKSAHLTVSVFGLEPYVSIDPETHSLKGGVAVEVLETMAKHLGFTWEPRVEKTWNRTLESVRLFAKTF